MLRTAAAFALGLAVGASVMTSAAPSAQSRSAAQPPAITQLRLFTIDRGRLDEFSDAWVKGVYALRTKVGFRIPFAAKIPATNQFVWLLTYSGPEPFEKMEEAYFASPERALISPDPAQWIARSEPMTLVPVVDLPGTR